MRELLLEFWAYARTRKKYWLLPTLVIMFLFGLLMLSAQGSAVGPFLYTLF